METNKRLVRMSITLGILTFISLILSWFALADIYKGIESDLRMEWNIVRVNIVLSILFITISLITIFKLKNE